MKSIEEQIEALTQELRPYPKKGFWYFDGIKIGEIRKDEAKECSWPQFNWGQLFASTNKAEVEAYADCYKRLKLYQLLAQKAALKYPIVWRFDILSREIAEEHDAVFFGTDFFRPDEAADSYRPECVLGGCWFFREEDRLEALKICGIDRAFQEKCYELKLGGG